ncbi:M48 family metallopeptidase [Methanimicrococcus sp. OttesenSCG-928-J09]|nr:M48 family metallopeptidase [Methanimicrococcus sp. OttesenSCG-928-J09]
MPPVRPAAGEKTTETNIQVGSIRLDCIVIFSAKRKKTLSYTVRYENDKTDAGLLKTEFSEEEDIIFTPSKKPVLFVRAPASLSLKEIQSVLLENEKNVIELLEKATQKEQAAQKKSKQSYKNGSIFHYMGRTYTLRLIYDETEKKIHVHLLDGQLQVYLPHKMIDLAEVEREKKIKKAVEDFYIEQADVFFNSRVDYFAEKYLDLLGKKPRSIKATYYKGKWGCCTYQNDIRLNWILIQAETPVIDYIIVHELCHIRHKDHSKDFWNLVRTIDPKYKEKRQELKENGWILGIK